MNDAFSSGESHWLTEPDADLCERCGDPSDGDPLCWRCDEAEHEAHLQVTEGNERNAS